MKIQTTVIILTALLAASAALMVMFYSQSARLFPSIFDRHIELPR